MEVRQWIDSDETSIEMLKRVFTQRPSLMLPPPLHRIPLRSGNVVEIAGHSPSAKTQILFQAAVSCVLPKECKGTYSGHLSSGCDEEIVNMCMKRFFYTHCYDSFELLATLKSRCTICFAEVKDSPLIPNHALRAATAAVKQEGDQRLFHNAALRKKRKDVGNQTDKMRKVNQESGDITSEDNINEKVLIKGNKGTPEKFVGKEAVVASQCLNGWYLLKIIEIGENVRLLYRSLQKIINSQATNDRCLPHSTTNGGV